MERLHLGNGSKRGRPVQSVGIVGYGHVGEAMDRFFSHRYETVIIDPKKAKNRSQWNEAKRRVNECEVGVICVPTPAREDGSCDVDLVEQTVGWLETPYILIKSTVPVGTTDRLVKESGKRIVFSPEFLGESTYWTPHSFHQEIIESPFFIFGGEKQATRRMVDLYLPIAGPVKFYRQTSARSAELAKYTENAFFSTKLAFCYEMAAICDALDIDYYELRDLWLLDPRVNPMHTAVFQDNQEPFSGKCLPKDIRALVSFASEAGYRPELLEEVIRSNRRIGELRAKAALKRKKKAEEPKKRPPRTSPRQLEIDSLLI